MVMDQVENQSTGKLSRMKTLNANIKKEATYQWHKWLKKEKDSTRMALSSLLFSIKHPGWIISTLFLEGFARGSSIWRRSKTLN
jgi:hypothetical protein